MSQEPYRDPQLFVINGPDLPLSSSALLELMQAVLERGKPFRFCARGWSMAPFIQDGDVITVSPFSHSQPGTGEVVAFVRPETGSLVVHRIVARGATSSLLQGDNGSEFYDGKIPQENLLGRVTRVERNGHPIWLGLGPERHIIARLSAAGLLAPLRHTFATLTKPFRPR